MYMILRPLDERLVPRMNDMTAIRVGHNVDSIVDNTARCSRF